MTNPSAHREVERKVRVRDDFELPDFRLAPGVTDVRDRGTVMLRATYHDTSDLALLRWGITLRRREGGKDAGWHLKLPVWGDDTGARDELHAPLESGPVGSVPVAFLEIIAPVALDRPVVPLVEVRTERAAYDLIGTDGEAHAEAVDDHVVIERRGTRVDSFREIEVEALDARDRTALAMLDDVVDLLMAGGGTVSTVSKAARALGPEAALPPDVPDLPAPGPDALAVDALRSILARHVRHLVNADMAVRRSLPDSVHQMRVAARRLRSTLATFAPLLDDDRSRRLRDELRWMASELGAIRDLEVLRDRLDTAARAVGEPHAERALRAIDAHIERRMLAARSSATAALRSDRHLELLEDLVAAVADPPVNDKAYVSCRKVLPPLMRSAWKRLARATRGLDLDSPSADWHAARIRAKQARYAAEALGPILGSGLPRLAEGLADATDVLGLHQDAFVGQELLPVVAEACDGPTGFALGLVHEYEAEAEILERLNFERLWPRVRTAARKAGVA